MKNKIYNSILEGKKQGKKRFVILIDPDKPLSLKTIDNAVSAGVDYFFIGGSLLTNGNLENCIEFVKQRNTR